jgi:hypothetical protein
MTIRSELKKILDIVADLAENDVKKDVLETGIIAHSGLPDFEVRNHLNELEWLRLVKEALPRSSHADFRLWSITEKGLQELSTEPSCLSGAKQYFSSATNFIRLHKAIFILPTPRINYSSLHRSLKSCRIYLI